MKDRSPHAVFASLKSLPPAFFLGETDLIAQALLNCALFTYAEEGTAVGGRIVETESYTQDDEASHSYRGERTRSRAMFMQGGTAYVYVIYGIYHCCNIVTGAAGLGNAVLIRALQPCWGLPLMTTRRMGRAGKQNTSKRPKVAPSTHALCRGPGCLSIALEISINAYNETPMACNKKAKKRSIHLMQLPQPMHLHPQNVVHTTRIGITNARAREQKRRFYMHNNPCVSHPLKNT